MSRYDGLIIPRSYSEYINKTDAATLLQALQLSGVMDNAPTANSNHPIKSSGVKTALTNVRNIYTSLTELNTAKGTSIVLENGVDNTQKILDVLTAGEMFMDYFTNTTNANRWGLSSDETDKINLRIHKFESSYANCEIIDNNTGAVLFIRTWNGTLLTPWNKVITVKVKTKEYTSSVNGNVVFDDIPHMNYDILSVYCVTDNTTLVLPYKVGAVNWGAHLYSDGLTPTSLASKTATFKIVYCNKV